MSTVCHIIIGIPLQHVNKKFRKCGYPQLNVIPAMAKNVEVSKQEENEEVEMGEKKKGDGT